MSQAGVGKGISRVISKWKINVWKVFTGWCRMSLTLVNVKGYCIPLLVIFTQWAKISWQALLATGRIYKDPTLSSNANLGKTKKGPSAVLSG